LLFSSSSYYYFIPSVAKIPRDFAQKLSKCKVLEFTLSGRQAEKVLCSKKELKRASSIIIIIILIPVAVWLR